MAEKEQSFYDRIAPVLLVVVVGLAFGVGVLWQKVSDIQKGGTGNTVLNNANAPTQPPQPATAKLDDARAAGIPLVSAFSESIKPNNGQKLQDGDHVRGAKNPEVLMISYSDYECPFCARFHPTALQALDEYKDKLAFVYRHFPLDSIHPNARPAAVASECIAQLGGVEAFWKFTDYIFENQTTSLTDLSKTAVEASQINKSAFDNCFKDNKTADKVESDYQSGVGAGVTGTPGNFIVNSKGEVWQLPGAVPYATLKQTIEEALSS